MAFNLFAQQKQQYYPTAGEAQTVTPGQIQGETVSEFASGKAGGGQTVVTPPSQPTQPVTPTPQTSVNTGGTPVTTAKYTPISVDKNNPSSGMDVISSMFTSPQEEDRLRKASVANQRILAVGDALRHIGNIYHSVNGGPAQQFNNPVQEESQRYQQARAIRDAANQRYLSYQHQKAVQDAQIKKMEDESAYRENSMKLRQQELDRLDKQFGLNVRKQDHKEDYDAAILKFKEMHEKGIIDANTWRRAVAWYNANTSRLRAEKTGGKGGAKGMDEYTTTTETTYNFDELGNKTGSTTTKKRVVNNKEHPTRTEHRDSSGNRFGGTRTHTASSTSGNGGHKFKVQKG